MIKYASTVLTVLAVAGVLWVLATLATPMHQVDQPQAGSADLSKRLASTEAEEAHLAALDSTIGQVGRYAVLARSGAGAQPPLADAAASGPTKSAQRRQQPMDVSIVYVSNNLQNLAINGTVYTVGDTIPGRGELVSIAMDSFVVKQGKQTKTYKLPAPHPLGVAAYPTNPR